MKLNCIHADTCLADYWRGHHLAHVQIPVYRGMHISEVKDAIRRELREGAVAGSDDIARLLSEYASSPEEEKLVKAATRAAFAAVNRDVRPAKKGKRKLFLDLEPDGKDSETVWSFFVFKEAE